MIHRGLFTRPSILERARFQKCAYLWFQVHKPFFLDSSMLAFAAASHICIPSPNKLLCLEKRLQLLLLPWPSALSSATHPFAGMIFHSARPSRQNGLEKRRKSPPRHFPHARLPLQPKRVRPKSTDATGNSFSPQTEWKIKHRRWGERWGKTHTSLTGGDCLTSGEIINKAGVLWHHQLPGQPSPQSRW